MPMETKPRVESNNPATRTRPMLLVIAYIGFISLGLPDAVIGVAWPSVRNAFGLPVSALGAILFGTGAGYFLTGLSAGRLLRTLGVGTLLALSTGLVAISLLGLLATMNPAVQPQGV